MNSPQPHRKADLRRLDFIRVCPRASASHSQRGCVGGKEEDNGQDRIERTGAGKGVGAFHRVLLKCGNRGMTTDVIGLNGRLLQ